MKATTNRLLLIAVVMLPALCGTPGMAATGFVSNLKAGRSQTIVTYGTSLTARGAWVDQLRQALDGAYPGLATVINAAEVGMWSQWGVENLDARVIHKNPDVVFIEFGFNDAGEESHISVESARQNIENMIDRINAARPKAQMILMTMNLPTVPRLRHRPEIRAYYQMYRDVAKARRILLIDHCRNWEAILKKDPALFASYIPDGLHPSAEACEKVITPEIIKSIGLRAGQSWIRGRSPPRPGGK